MEGAAGRTTKPVARSYKLAQVRFWRASGPPGREGPWRQLGGGGGFRGLRGGLGWVVGLEEVFGGFGGDQEVHRAWVLGCVFDGVPALAEQKPWD